jgi:hypothetical protein
MLRDDFAERRPEGCDDIGVEAKRERAERHVERAAGTFFDGTDRAARDDAAGGEAGGVHDEEGSLSEIENRFQ